VDDKLETTMFDLNEDIAEELSRQAQTKPSPEKKVDQIPSRDSIINY
jgi:hypothetical protein